MLKIGQQAPDFDLPDQNGNNHKLSSYKGRWTVVYFYPQDDTSGCTKEACAFRDNFPKFGEINAVVFGISGDSAQSHKQFSEKYSLPFTLLADESKKVIGEYGALGEANSINRISYLINPEGIIVKAYEEVVPEEHAAQILADLSGLK